MNTRMIGRLRTLTARWSALWVWLTVVMALCLSSSMAGDLAVLHRQLADAQRGAATPGAPGAPPPPPKEGLPPGVAPLLPLPAVEPAPSITSLGLERTDCLTGCPTYTVVFLADGSFEYSGVANVERLGDHRGSVSRGTFMQAARYVAAIDFMGLASTYDGGFLDNASVYTLVEWDGATKVILNVGNSAPATVWALEQLIDHLLESATWD